MACRLCEKGGLKDIPATICETHYQTLKVMTERLEARCRELSEALAVEQSAFALGQLAGRTEIIALVSQIVDEMTAERLAKGKPS